MKSVHILLSAYNGSKYIREQLDSLLQQDYNNIKIIIRDDGSKDDTVSIIEEYIAKYPEKIILYKGENCGWRKSFHWLMQHAGDADFYSFCDQDDHWRKNKISRAVSLLEKLDDTQPNIMLSDFVWCDGDMNRQNRNQAYKKRHGFIKYITLGDRNAYGFTEVFNKAALDAVKDKDCIDVASHDETVYLYCLLKGTTVWDDKIGADFRRHGKNASKSDLVGGNMLSHTIWRVKHFLMEDHRDEMYERFKVFYECFRDELSEEQQETFERYLGKKKRLRKALLPQRYRDTLLDELSIRILFLIGKV